MNGSAYNRTVPLQGGGALQLVQRQRPHVHMEGGVPRYLYNGGMLQDGTTFTMVMQTKRRHSKPANGGGGGCGGGCS